MVAGRFPRIEARLEPVAEVARARVHFRAQGTPHWYLVEMRPEKGAFVAPLPKPRKETKAFEYYIDVAGTAFEESRTPEYAPAVAPGPGGCAGKVLAVGLAAAKVLVIGPAGAPAVPAGFSAAGLISAAGAAGAGASGTAGGGGMSTGLIVAGAAGLAAAGALVATQVVGQEGGPISLEGVVQRRSTQPGVPGSPLAGAVVGTSLDTRTAITDGAGAFRLVTTVDDNRYCCEPYTVMVSAAGCQPFSQTSVWGQHPVGLSLLVACP